MRIASSCCQAAAAAGSPVAASRAGILAVHPSAVSLLPASGGAGSSRCACSQELPQACCLYTGSQLVACQVRGRHRQVCLRQLAASCTGRLVMSSPGVGLGACQAAARVADLPTHRRAGSAECCACSSQLLLALTVARMSPWPVLPAAGSPTTAGQHTGSPSLHPGHACSPSLHPGGGQQPGRRDPARGVPLGSAAAAEAVFRAPGGAAGSTKSWWDGGPRAFRWPRPAPRDAGRPAAPPAPAADGPDAAGRHGPAWHGPTRHGRPSGHGPAGGGGPGRHGRPGDALPWLPCSLRPLQHGRVWEPLRCAAWPRQHAWSRPHAGPPDGAPHAAVRPPSRTGPNDGLVHAPLRALHGCCAPPPAADAVGARRWHSR